ncbi:MAG: hypothetical protein H7Y59_05315 [Anaerolineales bacterium]|nr:hypothetical protein [Anaerolineales bacterium]
MTSTSIPGVAIRPPSTAPGAKSAPSKRKKRKPVTRKTLKKKPSKGRAK